MNKYPKPARVEDLKQEMAFDLALLRAMLPVHHRSRVDLLNWRLRGQMLNNIERLIDAPLREFIGSGCPARQPKPKRPVRTLRDFHLGEDAQNLIRRLLERCVSQNGQPDHRAEVRRAAGQVVRHLNAIIRTSPEFILILHP